MNITDLQMFCGTVWHCVQQLATDRPIAFPRSFTNLALGGMRNCRRWARESRAARSSVATCLEGEAGHAAGIRPVA
jgi:hypothetical protein